MLKAKVVYPVRWRRCRVCVCLNPKHLDGGWEGKSALTRYLAVGGLLLTSGHGGCVSRSVSLLRSHRISRAIGERHADIVTCELCITAGA